MPILLNETRNPNDQSLLDYPSSFGAYIGAKANEAFASNYVTGLLPTQGAIDAAQSNLPLNMQEMQNAYDPITGVPLYNVQPIYGPPRPKISKQEADGRIKDAGVKLTVPDDGIVPGALDLMIKNQQDRIARQVVIERSPDGLRNIAGFATSFAVSALDPLNVASAFVPVVGEMRYMALLGSAGGFFGRTAVRAGVGAAEGAVGSVLIEPLIYGMNQQLQNDYTMMDSLANIAFGTAFGGGLHIMAGGVREGYRGMRGLPNDFDYLRGLTMREAMDVQRFRADVAAGKVTDVEAATANFSDRMRQAAGLPDRAIDVTGEAPGRTIERARSEATALEAPFAKLYEITPEAAQARALDELKSNLRSEATAAAGNRAEPGAILGLKNEITRQDQVIARLSSAEEFKARAKEMQSQGMSRKEAESAARKQIETERANAQATRDRMQEQIDINATASQAEQALAALEKGEIPAQYADRVKARADQLIGAGQIAGAVNRMMQPPASMVAQMATPEQQAAALQVAVAHFAQGQTPNIEPFMMVPNIDQLQAAAARQQDVGSSMTADPEAAAAATERYRNSAAKDAKLEVARAEADKAQQQLDAAIKNLEASGASKELIAKLRKEAAANQDGTLYSQGQGAGQTIEGATVELRDAFDGAGSRLIDNGAVRVVQSVDELPPRADEKPHPADAMGYFDGQRAYLVADNLDPGNAANVLLHEVGAHYGMEKMLGPQLYRQLLSEIEAKAKAGVLTFRAALDAVPANTPAARIKDEMLAYLVQNQPDLPLVKRIISQVKQFIYRVLGGRFIDLNADDIRTMAIAALKRTAASDEFGVKINAQGNLLRAESKAGFVAGEIRGNTLHITNSEVAFEMRGQGEGVRLYQRLVDNALGKGLRVVSDDTVQPEAARMYDALARRGYDVVKANSSTETSLGTVRGNGQPAFEITGRTGDYAIKDERRGDVGIHVLGVEREARTVGKRVSLSNTERAAITKAATDTKLPQKDVEQVVRGHKLAHPANDGWAPLEFKGIKVEDNGKLTYQYQEVPYSFNTGADGKSLKPGTPEYIKRVNAVAKRMVDEVRSVFERAQAGDAAAKNILKQAGWYKEMRSRLRQEFGGLGDLFADLLGATSPNTPVRGNWDNAIDALRRAMRGDFDELMPKWTAWSDGVNAKEAEFRGWFDSKLKEGLSKKSIKDMPEYKAFREELKVLRELPEDLMPLKESGKKYGFNGRNVVRALINLWRVVKDEDADIGRGGTKPKALNFSGNLIGFRERATIDVWAARMLQRLAGFLRIPSMAEGGVSGNMKASGETTLQFGFGQDVFGQAAKDIRAAQDLKVDKNLASINDDDLQAVVWFVEKEVWTKNNWTSAAGEGGSFEFEADLTGSKLQDRITELRKTIDSSKSSPDQRDAAIVELKTLSRSVDRFQGGLSIQKSAETQGIDYVPDDPEMAQLANRVKTSIYENDDGVTVLGSKVLSTEGRYGGVERSIDLEVVTREGYDPAALQVQMLREAMNAQQDSMFLSRVLRYKENVDLLQHRPGVEIYFREGKAVADMQPILDDLAKVGVEYYTVIVDARRMPGAMAGEMGNAVGVRLQYIPEFDVRYGDETMLNVTDDELRSKMQQKADELVDLADAVKEKVQGVTFAQQFWYATDVRFQHEYQGAIDAISNRTAAAADQPVRAETWTGRPVREGLEAAAVQSRTAGRGAVSGEPDNVVGGNAGDQVAVVQAGIVEDIKASTKTFDKGVKDAEKLGEAVNAAAICGLRS
jgi:hypothetical protein